MVEQFKKIFVISDLHLGGLTGKRAFREADALKNFIETVRLDPLENIALVINGDIFDFLAGGPDTPEFNTRPEHFLRELSTDGDELQPVFAALGALLRDNRGRRLVLQLGNHDIELALPSAQEALREALNITEPLHHSRLTFETSGKGWMCLVDGMLVQVVHGNMADPWNVVDLAGLDRASRDARVPGATVRAPRANAGTRMVCHVLNQIKEDYPFVDLLKPEDAPLMAVLAATDAPTHYRGLMRAFGRFPANEAGELLGTGAQALPEAEPAPMTGPERAVLEFLADQSSSTTSDDVLRRAEAHLEENRRVRDLVFDDRAHLRSGGDFARVKWQQLAGAVARMSGTPTLASLRLALLRWLEHDHSFNQERLGATDRRILESVTPGVDVLIAGHTHLPRFQSGQPVYINTGTWMRVLKLTGSHYLASDATFESFFNVIRRRHDLTELDAFQDLDPRLRPVAVVDGQGCRLVSVKADGHLDTELRPQRE